MNSDNFPASQRVRIIPPRRAWLLINALTLVILAVIGFGVTRFAAAENQKLIDSQWETLSRSRLSDLARGDYRSFVEGIGNEFSSLYVEISGAGGVFKTGVRQTSMHCHAGVQDLIRSGEVARVRIEMCRPYESPVVWFVILAVIYLVVALLSLRMISYLESSSVGLLSEFFRSAGVPADPSQGLVGILSRVGENLAALADVKAREVAVAKSSALGQFAAQVAHDIRAPLLALNVALEDVSLLPDNKQMLAKSAVARVRDIANSLMEKDRELRASRGQLERSPDVFECSNEPFSTVKLVDLVQAIVLEKKEVLEPGTTLRVLCEPEEGADALFSELQPGELSRVLSNLINNSAEAMAGDGFIVVTVRNSNRFAVIEISDSGEGIPETLLEKLGARGVTSGKPNGNGLGLYHAKETIESWGGSFAIESSYGEGTIVTLGLLKS